MTTVTYEEIRGGMFDYAGDPPAPTVLRLRVVQFFDDGSHREIWRDAEFSEVFTTWDSSLLTQRNQAATLAGEKAAELTVANKEIARLTSIVESSQ